MRGFIDDEFTGKERSNMTEKKISGPHKTLKTAVYTALAGLGLMVLSLVVGTAISKGSSIPATVMYAMGVIGVILGAGGLLYAAVQLRCPYCGKSLMAGGRLPGSVPHFCPGCGKSLDDCG